MWKHFGISAAAKFDPSEVGIEEKIDQVLRLIDRPNLSILDSAVYSAPDYLSPPITRGPSFRRSSFRLSPDSSTVTGADLVPQIRLHEGNTSAEVKSLTDQIERQNISACVIDENGQEVWRHNKS
jgi:hypothetical protein